MIRKSGNRFSEKIMLHQNARAQIASIRSDFALVQQRREIAMRMLLFLLALFAVTAAIGTRAQAQNYPWCAQYSGLGGTNCGFTTFQQCMATLAGMGGFCNANTQYVPPAGSSAPRARRQW
jgi:Protein of unknown function (DUF3551)